MAKTISTLNGYEVVDKNARKALAQTYIYNIYGNSDPLTLTFTGKAPTRIPAGILLVTDQINAFSPITIEFSSKSSNMGKLEDINSVIISDNDVATISDNKLTITHNNYGFAVLIFFSYFGENVTITESRG